MLRLFPCHGVALDANVASAGRELRTVSNSLFLFTVRIVVAYVLATRQEVSCHSATTPPTGRRARAQSCHAPAHVRVRVESGAEPT